MLHLRALSLTFLVLIIYSAQAVDLSIKNWPAGVFEKYDHLNMQLFHDKPLATSNGGGIVTGTSSALAMHVASDALQKGLNAVDAAIAASAAQIVVAGGCYVSFAGIFHAMYYEAATGKVHYLNGNYNSVKNDTNPLTIPSPGNKPYGRQVLVPGYMRTVESAHKRFGTPGVSFGDLLKPAIDLAANGFSYTPLLAGNVKSSFGVISHSPEGPTIFNPAQKIGTVFKQPELAGLLRNVAINGADYMYTGLWASKMVQIVGAAGGLMTMDDLAAYQPLWGTPKTVSLFNQTVTLYAPGSPSYGGVQISESLNLAEQFQPLFQKYGPYDKSADSLFWALQIARWSDFVELATQINPSSLPLAFPDIDLSREGRFSKDTASKVYDMMTGINGTAYIKNQFIEYFFKFMTKDFIDLDPHHSDALVVGDSEGNLISIVHSINTKPFGTGLFVDGIALPDSAAIQRLVIKSAGPGNRVPDPVEPNIIMTNGRPLVASASIGGAERQVMFQNLLSILVWGRDVKQANDAPHFLGESGSIMAGGYMYSQKVASGLFDPNIINQVQNMGQPIKVVPGGSQPTSQGDPGYWVGVKRSNDNNKDPQYSASAPFTLNGLAEATL